MVFLGGCYGVARIIQVVAMVLLGIARVFLWCF